jgi:hypothetical protein
MILEYVAGTNDKGENIIRRQKFSKLKIDSKPEDIYAVAMVLEPLLAHDLVNVKLQEDTMLAEE